MVESQTLSGLVIRWGVEHRDGKGNLISRQADIQPPAPISCIKPACLWRYLIQSLTYILTLLYHERRVSYAEANRNKKILERYRMGDPSPKTLWEAIHANIKLMCPLCRKYNIDPLLRR